MKNRKLYVLLAVFLAPFVFLGCATTEPNSIELRRATSKGQRIKVIRLIRKGVDINQQNESGLTALICAARGGHTEIVQLLLEAGAEVNAKNYFGWTALMEATLRSHTVIVQLLLDADAEKDDLDGVISGADRIVVRDGGDVCCTVSPEKTLEQQEIYFEVTDPDEIALVHSNLEFKVSNYRGHVCECCGYPGIDWYKGGKRMLVTGVDHGGSFSCNGMNFFLLVLYHFMLTNSILLT